MTNPLLQPSAGYHIESLHLPSLADFPGFIYIKSATSDYMWNNRQLAKVALGTDATDALEGCTDFDFHWKLHADQMRENDRQAIVSRHTIHTSENCSRSDGSVYRLITYKIPLYRNNQLYGLLGISYDQPMNPLQSRLTPREQTCIALMSQGLSDKEIAARLKISRRTVETHFNSSRLKLNVKTRGQLIVMFCDRSC